MTILTIHQPENMPWAGYFNKMNLAETYVYLDHVQFRKNYFQNRNKIITKLGKVIWLTVPVVNDSSNISICDKVISNSNDWRVGYCNKIFECYSGAPFFGEYKDEIESLVMADYKYLIDFNMAFIDFFRTLLGISNVTFFSSSLRLFSDKSELILDICKQAGASVYISGPSGRDYLDFHKFSEAGVLIQFHQFTPVPYPSRFNVSGLSVLDILFNTGKDLGRYIL